MNMWLLVLLMSSSVVARNLLGTIENCEWAFTVCLMARKERRFGLLCRKGCFWQDKWLYFRASFWRVSGWHWQSFSQDNILYSSSDAAPLCRNSKKLEILSDLYRRLYFITFFSLYSSLALLACTSACFQCTDISHVDGKRSSWSIRC